jgi:hypothetical protein
LEQVTALLHQAGDPELTLANASVYLEAFGHLVMAWIWMEQAIAARRAVQTDVDFYAGKLQACQWFFRWELPRVDAQLDLLAALDVTTLHMQDNWF